MLSFALLITGSILQKTKRCDIIKRNSYGCFHPVIVYGWVEPRTDNILLDQNWLMDQGFYPPWYASRTFKNIGYGTCYGITCRFNKSGVIEFDKSDQAKVEAVYNIMKKYYIQENIKVPTLEYHQVLDGDAEWYEKGAYIAMRAYESQRIECGVWSLTAEINY